MKTPVHPIENFYFSEEALAELDKNILTVSKEYINHLIKQIHTDAEEDTLEIAILEELLLYIKEKREYHQNRQHESYNFVAFKWAALFLGALLLLIGLLYSSYRYYHLPKKMEMLALIEELKLYGVTIKECSKRVYHSTEYWLEMDDAEFIAKMNILNEQFSNGQLPVEQYNRIKNMINIMDTMINQIYKIHSTLHGKFKWIFVAIGSTGLYVIERIYFYTKQWYKSQYKECYEKFSWLETKIQKRILYVQKKSIVYDELRNLWRQFDPIGLYGEDSTWSDDEYDSYVFPIFKLLEKKVNFDELYQHIQFIIETHMGMENYNKTKIANFVHHLQNWHKRLQSYN